MQEFCILITSGSKFNEPVAKQTLTDPRILNMSGQSLRFVHLNSEELDSLIDEKNSANTTKVINSSVSVLKKFHLPCELNNMLITRV